MRDSFPWKKHRKILIDEEDCRSLCSLLNNGFSLQESIDILKSKANEEAFRNIESRLSQGEEAADFLGGMLPEKYRSGFSCLLKFESLSNALSLSVSIADGDRREKEALLKQLMYPTMLFTASTLGVLLFAQYCFPPLISMMESFQVDASGSIRLCHLIKTIAIMLIIASFLLCITFCFLKKPSTAMKLYQKISGHFPESMVVLYVSLDFVRFFRETVKAEASTRKVLQLLEALEDKPITSEIAHGINQKLQEGSSFTDAMDTPCLDPALKRFLRTAVYAGNLDEMLESYLMLSRQRMKQKTARLTRTIQLLSYSSIGMVLIMVYQILMMPLSVLSQF